MSRIGKKPIPIPDNVTVVKEDGSVVVRGPKGELFQFIPPEAEVDIQDKEIHINPKWGRAKKGRVKAQWGTLRALLANNVKGVQEEFNKKLEFEGVGYRVQLEGNSTLILHMGFNNPVHLEVPSGITTSVEKNVITVSGIDKQGVGQFAAQIRNVRKVEPYKGKGIRYQGEHVLRKAGKKVAAAK